MQMKRAPKKTVTKKEVSRKPAAAGETPRVRHSEERGVPGMPRYGVHTLRPAPGSHRRKKQLGRGPGSGHGKTSSRGSKGQTSRSGRDFYLGFEGGQTPMIRRIPKRGFISKFKKEYEIVNLKDISRITDAIITPAALEASGLIKDRDGRVKILGMGEVSKALSVRAHAFSEKAAAAIKNAGGTAELIKDSD
jgi:large subunit ribosomal protein L15